MNRRGFFKAVFGAAAATAASVYLPKVKAPRRVVRPPSQHGFELAKLRLRRAFLETQTRLRLERGEYYLFGESDGRRFVWCHPEDAEAFASSSIETVCSP